MKKLKLDVEELEVTQFQVENEKRDEKGTVHGHGPTYWYSGCRYCPNEPDTWTCGC